MTTLDRAIIVQQSELVALAADAARRGDIETLDRLLAVGVPADAVTPRGDSLLMLASYHGHAPASRLLIERGADPDRRNSNGQTPLAGAAFKGLIDVARALLDGGAGVDAAAPDGRTPLMVAAAFDRAEMVACLLERGASRDRRDVAGHRAVDLARVMGAEAAAGVLGSEAGNCSH